MKEKAVVAIVLAMILIGTMPIVTIVHASPDDIKIGVIGPHGLPHWSPAGMREGALIAAQEINDDGGVRVGAGDYRNITIIEEDEHSYPSIDIPSAQGAINNLYGAGCRLIVGGFRTEVTGPMIETALTQAEPVLFVINGAATNELICGKCLANYNKYKYLFRVNPVNDTMLLMTIAAGIQTIIGKMLPLFGCPNMGPYGNITQVKAAVLTEDLTWTAGMHYLFTNPANYTVLLGPYVNVTHAERVNPAYPPAPGYIPSVITNVINSGARIMILVFSAPVSAVLIGTWAGMGCKALPVGIDVVGQLESHWSSLGGACEYESMLNFVGTRTPVTPEAIAFWDAFIDFTSGYPSPPYPPPGGPYWPIYTAFGAYNAINLLKEAIETAESVDPDDLVPVLESIDTTSLTGKFKFATCGLHVPGDIYPHDVFCNSYGPTWPSPQYTRALICQWQAGRFEVVCPVDQSYTKDWCFPPWLYPYRTDINYDTKVDIEDIFSAALAFGTYPGHDDWDRRTDVNDDDKVDIEDIFTIALDFGTTYATPLWC